MGEWWSYRDDVRWLRRIRDWYITLRTRVAIDERECRHDGTEPMCTGCTRDAVGW